MITLNEIQNDISLLNSNFKTKDIDGLIKKYVKRKEEVEYNYSLLKNDHWLQRIFFYTHLKNIKEPKDRFLFIDKYKDLFSFWADNDQLIGFIRKCDFDFIYEYSKEYIKSNIEFIKRWGYVMYILHPSKLDIEKTKLILELISKENRHSLILAQAWLLCELAIYHQELIYDYLKKDLINYKIKSMTITKINDSFRISKEWKEKFKGLL